MRGTLRRHSACETQSRKGRRGRRDGRRGRGPEPGLFSGEGPGATAGPAARADVIKAHGVSEFGAVFFCEECSWHGEDE